jgi:hypothetical protein
VNVCFVHQITFGSDDRIVIGGAQTYILSDIDDMAHVGLAGISNEIPLGKDRDLYQKGFRLDAFKSKFVPGILLSLYENGRVL